MKKGSGVEDLQRGFNTCVIWIRDFELHFIYMGRVHRVVFIEELSYLCHASPILTCGFYAHIQSLLETLSSVKFRCHNNKQ